jgi:hypothetical protein
LVAGSRGFLKPGLSEVEALLLRRRVAEEVMKIASQQPGVVGGGWERWAAAILRPQIDWREVLSRSDRRRQPWLAPSITPIRDHLADVCRGWYSHRSASHCPASQ